MAAHTYWRINVTANNGDASFVEIAEIQMHTSIAGIDVCTGGTAAASTSGGGAAANAFDDNSSTKWGTTSGNIIGWISYNFSLAVDIVEYSIQAHTSNLTRAPKAWSFEYSDDGLTWSPVETREGQTSWTTGQTRTFTVTTTSNARLSQLPVEVLRTNLAVNLQISQLPVEVLRPNSALMSGARPVCFVCT